MYDLCNKINNSLCRFLPGIAVYLMLLFPTGFSVQNRLVKKAYIQNRWLKKLNSFLPSCSGDL
jgi:hypothetical protein